jgi:hypothetical protein
MVKLTAYVHFAFFRCFLYFFMFRFLLTSEKCKTRGKSLMLYGESRPASARTKGQASVQRNAGLGAARSKAAAIKVPHLQRRQVDAIQATGVDSHHVFAGRSHAFTKRRASALRAEAVFDLVFVEGVGGKIGFRGEQAKILARHKPVQRAAFAANRAIALHDFFKITLSLEGNLAAVAAAFVNH